MRSRDDANPSNGQEKKVSGLRHSAFSSLLQRASQQIKKEGIEVHPNPSQICYSSCIPVRQDSLSKPSMDDRPGRGGLRLRRSPKHVRNLPPMASFHPLRTPRELQQEQQHRSRVPHFQGHPQGAGQSRQRQQKEKKEDLVDDEVKASGAQTQPLGVHVRNEKNRDDDGSDQRHTTNNSKTEADRGVLAMHIYFCTLSGAQVSS